MENKLIYFYNIGTVQSKKLLNRLIELKLIKPNIDYSLTELRKILRKKEIFDELPLATRTDLIYNPLRVIPRKLIDLFYNELKKIFSGDKKVKFDIAGSYIRGKSTSGDVDLVLLNSPGIWEYFMNKINGKSKIIHVHQPFAQGPDKVSTLIEINIVGTGLTDLYRCSPNKDCKVNFKTDIFLSDEEGYVFAMLFATGSGTFNVRMRALAKKRGYLLNHKGLFLKKNNELVKIPVNTEKEIFEKLNMTYKEPSERVK